MANRPEPQLPFDRNEWFDLARNRLRWGLNTRVTKTCGHQFCDLTQSRCCACIDTRAQLARYYRYVDGQGMVADAKRWHDYCPGCKNHHRNVVESEPETSTETRMELEETRCVHCGEAGHAIWDCPRHTFSEDDSPTTTMSESVADGASSTNPHNDDNHSVHIHSVIPPSSPPQSPLRSSLRQYLSRPWLRMPRSEDSTEPTSPTNSRLNISPPRPMPRLSAHQQRRARVQAHFERSFGSLTDIANDPDYISPIASLYGNAYDRFQERERERRERQAANPGQSSPPSYPSESYRQYLRQRPQFDPWNDQTEERAWSPARDQRESNTQQVLEALRRQLAEDDRRLLVNSDSDEQAPREREEFGHPPSIFGRWYDGRVELPTPPIHSSRRREQPPRPKTPEALAKEELTISNECKVCFSQHCDMLLLPCAHLALCEVYPLLGGSLLVVVCAEDVS
jgi:hypothetical protein